MVAYKTSHGYQKDYLYQRRNYRPPASMPEPQCIQADNNLDDIVRSSTTNEIHQKNSGHLNRTGEYDLLQPVWFYKIMEMLANNDARKEKEKTYYSRQTYVSLN